MFLKARRPLNGIAIGLRTWALFVLTLLWCVSAPTLSQSEERLQEALRTAAPEKPFEVGIGVRVEQIVGVNQKAENFEVVGDLRLQWDDHALAFDPQEYSRTFKQFTREEFAKFADEKGLFTPAFEFSNQQGRRFTQTAGVLVFSDGHAIYGERFALTLQAPEFDFVQYPFDTQHFFIHVHAVYPLEFMRFAPLEGFSRLGEQLGEEEWIFATSWTDTSAFEGTTGMSTSRFSFGFEAYRHLNYYLLRIFLPIAIIILVSWLTFFLQDFGKRVDVGGANLLIFVAFNFTISNDLPRLGYMTFMDAIMVATFVFSALVVIVNVIFKRMEVVGKEQLARQIDRVTLWTYPFTLAALVLLGWYKFLAQ